jgi:outer membrane protein TolC
VDAAVVFLKLEQARYDTGIDPYIDVLIAQTTVLGDQQTLNGLQVQEMASAVALVEALGGGWDRSQLPSPSQVTQKPDKATTTIQQ